MGVALFFLLTENDLSSATQQCKTDDHYLSKVTTMEQADSTGASFAIVAERSNDSAKTQSLR